MEIPVENVLAFAPPSRKVGSLVLKPLTLAGAVALEALGVSAIDRRVPPDKVLVAAAVLSGAPLDRLMDGTFNLKKFWRRHCASAAKEVAEACGEMLAMAWATYVEPPRGGGKVGGNGLYLDLLDFLMAEYSMPPEAAMAEPLSRVWALVATRRSKLGQGHGGPDYVERQKIERMMGR